MKAISRNAGDARAFIAAGDLIKLHVIGYLDGDKVEETDVYVTDEMDASDEDYQLWKDEVRASIDKLTQYWGITSWTAIYAVEMTGTEYHIDIFTGKVVKKFRVDRVQI